MHSLSSRRRFLRRRRTGARILFALDPVVLGRFLPDQRLGLLGTKRSGVVAKQLIVVGRGVDDPTPAVLMRQVEHRVSEPIKTTLLAVTIYVVLGVALANSVARGVAKSLGL